MLRMSCPYCNAEVSTFSEAWRSEARQKPRNCPHCQRQVRLAFRGPVFFAWLVGLVALSYVAGRLLGLQSTSSLLPGIGGAPIIALFASGYLRKAE